ncbi:MAG: 2-oxoglutarate dehydrogenase E1 component [Rhizobiales bacterium]|nr:2-oxoglutarate dehydrogenase E1 component [Hyphomicrobiales bacterium]MBI3674046.1 2-oxoglutarate dehydrogenase E1 component [Hyphomicrobiales bacterium]
MNKTDLTTAFEQTSFLYGGNAQFIEQLYGKYLENPAAVDQHWRQFFAGLEDNAAEAKRQVQGPSWQRPDWPVPASGELVSALDGNWPVAPAKPDGKAKGEAPPLSLDEVRRATTDSVRALMMIRAFRMRGHLAANLDPLSLAEPKPQPELDPASYGFGEADLDRPIFLDKVLGLEHASIRQITDILRRTYCSTLGVEFMHISDPIQKAWIQERIEGEGKAITFTPEGKKAILAKLVSAEGFENFLNVKYTGTKRFGLDGGEAMIPALEQIIKRGGNLGVKEIVLGMAHRGRLNVLANVMSKPFSAIFHEFTGGSSTPDEVEGSGDVKYHLGSSSDRSFDGNTVHLSLTANPSHLEIVDPVVLGKARAKQDQRGDKDRTSVLPLLIHGDAAFAGQGVVAECFGLSGLRGHRSGGSIHFIVNNQIGFTTSPHWARSSPYPSDVAKMIEAPILHCNGDDPEAVVFACKIATEFRQRFKKPVVVDMFCYRRFGHNETDEPFFTQPLMYKRIGAHETVVTLYGKRLVAEGIMMPEAVDAMKASYRKTLDEDFSVAEGYKANKADWLDGRWAGLKAAQDHEDPRQGATGVPVVKLREIGLKLTKVPKTFKLHRTLQRVLDQRRKMVEEDAGLDWAMAEQLAFATLVGEGFPVRLSGQDVQRGTFSQRHAVLVDQETDKRYTPVNHLVKDQKVKLEVINSMLSEEAVLGFEYGYSLAEPNTLVIWEAQFGDFANGAQVVFDQFISSGERKWLRMSALVCLLPHGYEGQGPEHSSARLERFLQLCAEDNMQVANCSTPANYFHILRRQMKRDIRKPLIIMTPKSLLRHKRATSRLDELSEGTSFHRLLRDDAEMHEGETIKLAPDAQMRRVVMCSGKVYYDLYEERDKRGLDDIYLLRVEQLYPWPHKALIHELGRFKQAEFVWCQEEPYNMGAWSFAQPNIERVLDFVGAANPRPHYVGRPPSAATATGLMSKHLKELKTFLDDALGDSKK